MSCFCFAGETKTGKKIHGEIAYFYESSAPSYGQVKFWVGEFKRGRKTGKKIHGEIAYFYESSVPSYGQYKFWVGEFKRGKTFLEDEARSGCPLDATDEEMCKKVWDLLYSARRIQVEEIAQALGQQ